MITEQELQILKAKRNIQDYEFIKKAVFVRREYSERIELSSSVGETVYIDNALTSYFYYNLSLYIIQHKQTKKFYISFFTEDKVEDIHWHYVNTLGSNTIGDGIRKDGVHNFEFKILGKFDDFKIMKSVMQMLNLRMKKKYDTYRNSGEIPRH